MPFLVFFLVAIVTVVVQTTFLRALPFAWGAPDLIFILVVFVAYRFAWLPGLLLVFCTAWMFEVTASLRLGIYAIQCLVVFILLKTFTRNSPIRESFYQIPLAVLAFVLSQLFSLFVSLVIDQRTVEWGWWPLLRDSMWFTVAAWILFKVFDALLSSVGYFSSRGRPMAKSLNGRRNL